MNNTILLLMGMILFPVFSYGQFLTITRDCPITRGKEYNRQIDSKIKSEIIDKEDVGVIIQDSIIPGKITDRHNQLSQKDTGKKLKKSAPVYSEADKSYFDNKEILPELTIANLYEEIKRNGIKYPKIVLAQAILETGWFKSNVCRNKHNLFGLTNPRTKDYYEFDHWTESVKAYYTKVQYRYKGGNYLLWLKKIGYAEDPGYIKAVIKVLKQL